MNSLKHYRSKSSFNVEDLKHFIDSREIVDLRKSLFDKLENDPLFERSSTAESLDEIRRKGHLRARRVVDYGFLHDSRGDTVPLYFQGLLTALAQYDLGMTLRTVMSTHFFGSCIRGLGSAEQQRYFTDACDEKITGCFAMTEIGHGSDVRHMRTIAAYDSLCSEFVLHTPDFQAAKCWAGLLGQWATHAIVFAQLVMPDGQSRGLHAFVVLVRDPVTLRPCPGVSIGDMGEKCGLNAVDNGFCVFDHYRIPRESLLSRFATVTADGQYVSPIADPQKRFALSLGTLVGGRVSVLSMCVALLSNALTIAIRYSAVRQQFGPADSDELPVLEYPLQQWRLFPPLAALFCMKSAARVINTSYFHLLNSLNEPSKVLNQDELVVLTELHILLASLKALFSWTAQAAIQQCREACGGHGYLKRAGFDELRSDNDVTCTFEGDNNVLPQQASNWLLRLWEKRGAGRAPPSPLGSITFLYESQASRMMARSLTEICHPPVILEAYKWLICWLVAKTSESYQSLLNQSNCKFTAQNHSQVHRAKSLATAYGEHYLVKCLWDASAAPETGAQPQTRAVVRQLCALYGLSALQRHLVYLHQGGYVTSSQSQLVQDGVSALCSQLKDEAVSLVDVVAPPDSVLNSVLGHSSGEVYKNLQQALYEEGFGRPDWWQQLSGKLRSRL